MMRSRWGEPEIFDIARPMVIKMFSSCNDYDVCTTLDSSSLSPSPGFLRAWSRVCDGFSTSRSRRGKEPDQWSGRHRGQDRHQDEHRKDAKGENPHFVANI